MKAFFGKKYVFLLCFLAGLFAFSGYSIYNKQEVFIGFAEEISSVSAYDQMEELLSDMVTDLQEQEDITADAFTELYGVSQRILGKREYRNFSYVRGDSGMIYYGAIVENKNDMLMEYAKRTGRAARCAEEQGAETIFVMAPSKIIYDIMGDDKELPLYDTNAVQNELLLYLQQNEVKTLDLRIALAKSGMTQEELFYRTDYIWTPEAAFIAAGAIVDKIRNDFDDDWDPRNYYCDRSNYVADTYHQATIGATGKETGILYAGKEDYTVIYPGFETDMEWYNLEDGWKKAGDFYAAFVDLDDAEEGVYADTGSNIYLNGIVDRDRIVNEANPDGPKVLCLRDSYMSPVACFLAPMCSQIDMVWARSNHNRIDYEQLIRDGGYDYLIIEVYPYNIYDNAFEYFKD